MLNVLEKNWEKSRLVVGYIENVCSHLHDSVSVSVISSAFSSLCHIQLWRIKQTVFKRGMLYRPLLLSDRHRLTDTRTLKCFCLF